MASLANDPGGRRRILFVDGDGNRKAIRLGKMSKRQAEAVKLKIEDLVASKLSGSTPCDETARWLKAADDTLRDKLATVGLAERRERLDMLTLGVHLANYFTARTDVKQATIRNWNQAARCLK